MNVANTERPQNVRVDREREVAFESPDHLEPWGTRRDNSRNHRFNEKLYKLFSSNHGPLAVLDMGCSGGGFVKDCIDDGCFAIGLEGSDFSKRSRRAEWRTIPEFLFTCDVTGNFDVLSEGEGNSSRRVLFNVVTCWEMIEHLTEDGIERVTANVKKHLAPGGVWIMSVSPNEEIINGVRLHQTVQPREWWIQKFSQLGLHHIEELVKYFNTQFIRGPKYEGPGSFILILTSDPKSAPKAPSEGTMVRLFDKWRGSAPQRLLERIVVGK
jgi:2-polyprenyl-3-methyl-5-hydroxy-6-metoxy-1,4-benzoquinol methylase